MEEREEELIYAAGVRTIVLWTNFNNDILNLERSRDLRTKERSFRSGFKLQQSRGGAAASEPRPC